MDSFYKNRLLKRREFFSGWLIEMWLQTCFAGWAGNDLTDRGFGYHLWDTTLLGNDLPLSERYSDKRYS
jgi:hypothetical protein